MGEDGKMFLLFVTFLFVAFSLIRRQRPNLYPPGPRILPVVGNIPVIKKLLRKLKFHHLVWQSLSETYGSLVGLRLITDNVVVVSGKDQIRKLYQREELNGRPDGFFFRIRSFDKRLGLVFTDGQFWEEQRLFSVKAMKSLGLGKLSMMDHIESEAKELIKHLSKSSGKIIDVQRKDSNIFDISVINTMWTILRGERFALDDEQAIGLMETIHKSFQVVDMSGGILSQVPWLRFLAPDRTGFRPLVETMKPLWRFLRISIDDVAKCCESTNEPTNFVDLYCRELLKRTKKDSFSREQLLALCIDFFQAGSETTSNTLSFGIMHMCRHANVLRKVREELDLVVGNRYPRMSDRPKLKFTEAVLCEVQRISNVAPLGIAHRALSDVKVDEFVIPRNAIVLFNIYSMHMDEIYWENPLDFKPERFLCERGNLLAHESFIPFGKYAVTNVEGNLMKLQIPGLGKRRCIGENLAKSSLFLFFASFVHFFDFSPVDGMPEDTARDGITLSPQPFAVKLIKRRETSEV